MQSTDHYHRRGKRLELEDVAHHLHECDVVQHAAVFLPATGPLMAKLVAVFTLNIDRTESSSRANTLPMLPLNRADIIENIRSIETCLVRTLPGHAVPTIFVPVLHLPRTASGKLNRPLVNRWLSEMGQGDAEQFTSTLGTTP